MTEEVETTVNGDETSQTETVEELKAALDEVRAALKAANSESAGRRRKLKELEDAEEARKLDALSEAEKLQRVAQEAQAEVEQLRRDYQLLQMRSAVLTTAAELGFANAEDAFALMDMSTVEITEGGEVRGYKAALKKLAESGRLPMKDGSGTGPQLGTPARAGVRAGQPVKAEPPPITARL
jgi:hypothetical protein